MHLENISIEHIGGIDNLVLNLDSRMNILCGPNGIGKTTILECIAHLFTAGASGWLKRNARHEKGEVRGVLSVGDKRRDISISLSEFSPLKDDHLSGAHDEASNILVLKVGRTFEYKPLDAVGRDQEKSDPVLWNDARKGVSVAEVKNWFVNRYLYSKYETLTEQQINNFELARDSFGVLNPQFSFSRVDAATNEIMVSTPSGEIYFEYLSSGFKSCLSMIFGIIKEIEFRFTDVRINAQDFSGIVAIDEIELHLHPEWQSVICGVLLKLFPKSQFICTTHSPHVIQAAEARQIVAIEQGGNGVQRRELPESQYGFKGWTIEEVLTDVMGMRDLMTEAFHAAITNFELAIDDEDVGRSAAAYRQLDAMLHPHNRLRKMLRMQLFAAGGEP